MTTPPWCREKVLVYYHRLSVLTVYLYFVFWQLNFIVVFQFLIKYYHILFIIIIIIIIVFWLGCDRPSGLLLFVPALLLSILTSLSNS